MNYSADSILLMNEDSDLTLSSVSMSRRRMSPAGRILQAIPMMMRRSGLQKFGDRPEDSQRRMLSLFGKGLLLLAVLRTLRVPISTSS